MKEKLITIVTLPYSKAYILKSRLEIRGIECELEDLALIEGIPSLTFKVMILEKDLQPAIQEVNDFLGIKPVVEKLRLPPEERHILVPIDFSLSSEKACKMAFNLAQKLNLKLVLMHCYINPFIHSLPYSDVFAYDSGLVAKLEFSEENANELVRKFVKNMMKQIGKENWKTVHSEIIIKPGYADEDILSYVNSHHSELIVMGSGGNLSAPVGSVTIDVIYNSIVPVLVIPEKARVSEISDFTKVVYATNFDEKDFKAVEKLMSLLYPFRVKLFCVHVGQKTDDFWDSARMQGMKNILEEKFRDQEFECRILEGDNIPGVLEEFINEEKINLVSLTTHKRNMISRLFNPGIAKKMAYHSHLPLLVFHG